MFGLFDNVTERPFTLFAGTGTLALVVLICFTTIGQLAPSDSRSGNLAFESKHVEVAQLSFNKYAALKVDIAESSEPPDCGLFGAHMVGWMGSPASSNKTFFNYSIYHISFQERLQLLRYLAEIDRLPTECIVLALPNPQFGPDQYLYDWGELPRHVQSESRNFGGLLDKTLSSVGVMFRLGSDRLKHFFRATLDWKNFVRGFQYVFSDLFHGLRGVDRFFGDENPYLLGMYREHWFLDIQDGSTIRVNPDQEPFGPVGFYETSQDISWNIPKIVEVISEIAALCQENKRKLILVIPPVYMQRNIEHENETAVSEVISRFPGLRIQDDREKIFSEFFRFDPYHPTENYWESLAQVLER